MTYYLTVYARRGIESLKVKHQNDMYDYSASVEQLRQEHDRKKRQLDILYGDRLSERISLEWYDEMSKRIIQEQADLEERITGMVGRKFTALSP